MPESANVLRLTPDAQCHVVGRLAQLPEAVRALHEQGKILLARQLERFFDAADDALFDMADRATSNCEQNAFFDSMREVRVQRKGVEQRFFDDIDTAFVQLTEPGPRDAQRPEGELSSEALSLVQNDDLEQLVAFEATIEQANSALQDQVSGLEASLRDLVSVPVCLKNNPFGAQVLCIAAMNQVKRLDIDIKAKVVLFQLFDQLVIAELGRTYGTLQGKLQPEQGSNGPPSVQEPALVQPRSTEPAAIEGEAPVAKNECKKSSQLVQLLGFAQSSWAKLDHNATVSVLLEQVQKLKGVSLRFTKVEQETINLVEMLFEYMLKDHGLDNRIKHLLLNLQVPVLKVALLDTSFFTEKSHAARRLLNEISCQAMGWQADKTHRGPDEPFVENIQRAVTRVTTEFDLDANVFNQALADFSSFVEQESRRADTRQRRVVDAEDGKARAQCARITVGQELQQRLGHRPLPTAVRALIYGPLSNVLFVTILKHGEGSPEWQSGLALVADIANSVDSEVDSKQLVEAGPALLARLRASLDFVSYNPFEVSKLLLALEELHLALINGKPIERFTAAASDKTKPQTEATPPPLNTLPDAHDTSNASSCKHRAAEPGLPDNDPHMQAVTDFVQGSWFDFKEESGEVLRCRLAAHIKPTGKYVFVNRAGMKAAEKTQQQLAWALKKGLLETVDSGMVFDRALESIVSGMRNSKTELPFTGAQT